MSNPFFTKRDIVVLLLYPVLFPYFKVRDFLAWHNLLMPVKICLGLGIGALALVGAAKLAGLV